MVEGNWISLILGNVMLPKFCGLCFTYESWDTKLVKRVEALPCKASFGAIIVGFLCVAPLWLRGIRGKKSTPSIG